MKKLALLLIISTVFAVPPSFSATNVSVTAANAQGVDVSMRCNDIEIVNGSLWVALDGKILKVDKETGLCAEFAVGEMTDPGQYKVWNIATRNAEDIWFSCSIAGAAHYVGTAFKIDNGINATTAMRCSRVAIDNEGKSWVSTGAGGIWKFEADAWTLAYPYMGEGVGMYYTTGMEFDSDGALWWTSSQMADGFGYCTPTAGCQTLTRHDETLYEALSDYRFVSLAIDEADTKWMGLNWPEVVAYHKDGKWERIKLIDELESGVDYAFDVNDAQVGPDGRFWVAYKQSLFAISPERTVEEMKLPLNEEVGVITCFKHDGDDIWIGTSKGGVIKWNGTSALPLDLAAGVESVVTDSAVDDTPIYDLNGRRVEQTMPGQVYVRGGRKFVEVR